MDIYDPVGWAEYVVVGDDSSESDLVDAGVSTDAAAARGKRWRMHNRLWRPLIYISYMLNTYLFLKNGFKDNKEV